MAEETLEVLSNQSTSLTTLKSPIEDIQTVIFEKHVDSELPSDITSKSVHHFFGADEDSTTLWDPLSNNVTTEDVTTEITTKEMFPYIDENVGNYIALGFFFAFVVAVIILVSVVAFCCLKRRQKMRLEKSIVKVENPKYSSQPSRYPADFDFISSQNVRAEYRNKQDESSATLTYSPQVTISIDNQSTGTSLYSPESHKTEKKRLSKTSDYPEASLASLRNDSCSDASLNRTEIESTDGRSPFSNRGEGDRLKEGTMKKEGFTQPVDNESEGNAPNSESLSCPLLGNGESKNFGNRFLRSKESEILDDNDDVEDDDDDDEHNMNQSTSLLKSKEQSLLSLGSYDRSLNPFCN